MSLWLFTVHMDSKAREIKARVRYIIKRLKEDGIDWSLVASCNLSYGPNNELIDWLIVNDIAELSESDVYNISEVSSTS